MYLKSGYVGFASNVSWNFTGGAVSAGQYDFLAVAAHEVAEVMGRQSGLNNSAPTYASILDLARYSAPGVQSFSYNASAYASIDGGVTNLGVFNNSGGGDRGDWNASLKPRDTFDAYFSAGVSYPLSTSDLTELDVLGFGQYALPTGIALDPAPGDIAQGSDTAVPEPAAWAMMLAGFGLVGAAMRRRTHQAV